MASKQQVAPASVDPAIIMADDNARFGLKETRVDSMMASILEMGGIRTPVKVTRLETPSNGYEYRLNEGHYRHAAALRLNREQNAGVMVPIDVEPEEDALTRLKRQISENNDRENLSPMDKAVDIKRLLDLGVSKIEVRKIFSMPGGKKGLKNQPASNSFINVHLSFLELPKKIQERIHDGRITYTAGYELTKVTPDEREALLIEIEEDRLKQIDRDEQAEEKLLNAERKLSEAEDKAAAAKKELEEKQQAAKAAEEALAAKMKEATEAFEVSNLAKEPEERKKAQERLKAAQADVNAAKSKTISITKEIAKVQTAAEKAADAAQKEKDKLESARAAKKAAAPAKSISGEEVKKKAAAKGVTSSTVALKLPELLNAFRELEKAKYKKVASIGKYMLSMARGVHSVKQTVNILAEHVTEELEKKK